MIDAPLEKVWGVMKDVRAWPTWTPTVKKVQALGDPELKAGARFKVKQPGLPAGIYTVTKLSSNRFVWEAIGPGMKTIADHRVQRDKGRSLVRLEFEYQGTVGKVLAAAFAKMTGRFLELEAEGLKKHCEALG